MSSHRRGFLTMAVGNRRFLEMALPVALCTDEALASVAQEEYAGVFDEVTLVYPRFRDGLSLKYGSAEASPFEEAVFVDADCIVLGSLDGVFDVLEHEDLAMLGEHLTVADDRNHHGFSTQSLIRWLGDEIAFGVVGGRRRVGLLPPPGPMYWPSEFAELSLSSPPKPVLHMIHPPPDHTLEPLFSAILDRRRKADLPGDGRTHWEWEIAKLRRSSRLGAVARRLGMRS